MLPERLQSRIRHQLSLASPDLEARALAIELAELGKRARERLEQCATLIRLGNEQAALQAAEAEPSLPDLCASLGFAGSEAWARLCEKHGLPTAPPPDDAQVLAVELLYGKPIEENHPLYRDYRQAIRERDDARALTVLRSIAAVNPGDGNARAELERLGAKFMRESLAKVAGLFARGDAEAATRLMDRMEQLGTSGLAGDPGWEESLRLRGEWIRAQSRRRIADHAARARDARAAGDWQACADAVGAARTLERNAGVRAEDADAATLGACESWAGEHVAAEAAAHRARAEIESLRDEWSRLSEEASRRESADLLRRLNQWLERAQAAADRLDPSSVDAAGRLSRALHQRLVRRHTLRTAAGVGVLLLAVLAGHLAFQSLRARSAIDTGLRQAEMALESWDEDAAERALAESARLATTPELVAELSERASPLRDRARNQRAQEAELATEAAFLAETRVRGVDTANFAETARRARELQSRLRDVGAAAKARISRKAGDLADLVATCEKVGGGLRATTEGLVRELTQAVGDGEKIGDPAKAAALAERIRSTLGSPGALQAVGPETGDPALALAERVTQRLEQDRARQGALQRLDTANDLRAYLSALANLAAETVDSPERRAAKLLAENAAQLDDLPRCLLGARAAAMWDGAATAKPPALTLNPEEAQIAARITDDALVRNLRKYIIREHVSPEPGVSEAHARESELVVGPVSAETRPFPGGNETVYTGKVLRSSGDVVDARWSLRTFINGVVSGKEPTEGLPIPEVDYLRRFSRYFAVNRGQLAEPALRTLERVRRENGAPMLRAFHLQELYRLAAVRAAESGLAFSPSAQRDAAELRGITQNNLRMTEFAFSSDTALKSELGKFLARNTAAYADEARFLRAMMGAMRRGGLVLVGRVDADGRPSLKGRGASGQLLVGLGADGRPAVLFECGDDGVPELVANPAPLSPLLRLATPPSEAATAAGKPPADLAAPAGGWDSLLKGKDL